MNFTDFKKYMGKAHCRVEKTVEDELHKITVYARTSKHEKDKPDEVKIFSLTGNPKSTLKDLTTESLSMFLQAGVKLTLLSIAEARTEKKGGLLGLDGKPMK